MDKVLEARDVVMQFGGLTAVSHVNMDLYSGELVGLIGPNGAGKTTFFNVLTGVYEPTEGEITLYNGVVTKRLNGEKPYTIAKNGIARTFQNIRLFSESTVIENVLMAMHPHSDSNVLESIFRLPSYYRKEAEMRERALELLEIFSLEGKCDEQANKLSYGEQRRLEIVRALATNPKILFLDEPAAGMNPQETDELTDLIAQIRRDFNITIVLIEHDMSLVMRICQRIYVLEYGRLIAEGTPKEIRANEAVIRAYLGGD